MTDALLCPDDSISTFLIDAPRADARSIEVGTVVGQRYVVESCIGRGGFGAVFSARHTGTGQEVALKVLNNGGDLDDVTVRRFFQEARVTSGLKHANTIRVFDFGQDDSGLFFLAMERLVGTSLKQELKRRIAVEQVFSEEEAIHIGVGVLRSLAEAHAVGLVHRDLKPDNIFLQHVEGDEPQIKVLDFGIVKLADSTLTLGSDSGVPGTPAFMSPEQVVKSELDGRSDIYSLGVVLFQLVSGVAPLKGDSMMQTLYLHVHEAPPDLRQLARTPISSRFASLVHRALEKDPKLRPKDAQSMRSLLEACRLEAKMAPITLHSENAAESYDADTVPAPGELAATVRVRSSGSGEERPALFQTPLPGDEHSHADVSVQDASMNGLRPPTDVAKRSWALTAVLGIVLSALAGVLAYTWAMRGTPQNDARVVEAVLPTPADSAASSAPTEVSATPASTAGASESAVPAPLEATDELADAPASPKAEAADLANAEASSSGAADAPSVDAPRNPASPKKSTKKRRASRRKEKSPPAPETTTPKKTPEHTDAVLDEKI